MGDQLVQPRTPSPQPATTRATTELTTTLTPSPTVTPTETSVGTAPVVSGPTTIPLKFDEAIDQIGAREVIDVDINPKNPKEVYALVKGDGIYKSSTNGTGPWAKMKVDAVSVVALVIDPTNPTRLYGPTWTASTSTVRLATRPSRWASQVLPPSVDLSTAFQVGP